MKTIIYGSGKDIERQYAKCTTFAMMNGYDTAETTDTIPKTIERLSQRDINAVLIANMNVVADDEFEYEIVESTFARYGARLIIAE